MSYSFHVLTILIWITIRHVESNLGLIFLNKYPSPPSNSSSRYVQTFVNPGCDTSATTYQCNTTRLVYTTSTEGDNTDHYIWTHSDGVPPAFFMVESQTSSSPNINWYKLLSNDSTGSVNITGAKNAIGVQINGIFFFNDLDKSGKLNVSANDTKYQWLENFTNVTLYPPGDSEDTSEAVLSFHNSTTNFTVNFYLYTKGFNGRNPDLPRLQYTPRSFHVEVLINGTSNVTFARNRVAMDVSVYHFSGSFTPVNTKTIDDEWSPGVFAKKTATFKSSEGNETSFMEWKPVGYSKSDRIIAHTVDANCFNSKSNFSINPVENNALKGFFSTFSAYDVSRFNITFGSPKDSFYSSTNYTSFSFLLGFDDPPEESLSLMVKMVILTGFGIPVIAIMISGLYLTIRRCRRSSSYEDLLSE